MPAGGSVRKKRRANPAHDYSKVNAAIGGANKFARRYNKVLKGALAAYGSQGPAVSGVGRGHFPPGVKDELRALMRGFNDAQDSVVEVWRWVHPRTDFYRSKKAAPFRAKMVKAGHYGTGTKKNPEEGARSCSRPDGSFLPVPQCRPGPQPVPPASLVIDGKTWTLREQAGTEAQAKAQAKALRSKGYKTHIEVREAGIGIYSRGRAKGGKASPCRRLSGDCKEAEERGGTQGRRQAEEQPVPLRP